MSEGLLIREMSVNELKQIVLDSTVQAVAKLTMPEPDRLLSQREVTARFGLKRSHLLNLHKAGKLCYKKNASSNVWREGDVRAFVNSL